MTILDLDEFHWNHAAMPAKPPLPAPFLSSEIQGSRRFYLNLKGDAKHALGVISGGWEKCAPDYRMQRQDFPYLCVEYVAGGKGRLKILDATHELSRGTIFAYGPGCPHLITTDPDNTLSKYYVDFVGGEALKLLKSASLLPGVCKQVSNIDEVQTAFEHVITSGQQSRKFSPRIAALELEILILKIADVVAPKQENYQSYQTFLKCRNYLDEHFQELSTAEQVAGKCHVAPEYLSRLFARYGSESLYRYLSRKKMSHGAELLDSGRFIVGEVAEKLGMDPFHFSRAFKRVHGMSPSSFMQRRGAN
ncbi:MAG: AraC family transcriptional regulator [Chthoniobacterales bacterium]